jgi:hypothetical protein
LLIYRTRPRGDEHTACESHLIKRPLESDDITPASKKTRYNCDNSASIHHTTGEPAQEVGSPVSCIVRANKGLPSDDSIEDFGSTATILPTILGKHSDLNTISSQTMSAILDGHYDNQMTKVTIIDCRYPYEYEGGHIKVRIKLYDSII